MDKLLHDSLRPATCPTGIPSEIINLVDTVDWTGFGTAYGEAEGSIPHYLKNLFCSDSNVANEATHQLWCSLCHQHAFISSAALPAYPILIRALINLDEKPKIEILDIMSGFASCLHRGALNKSLIEWEIKLYNLMLADRPLFKDLAEHPDKDINNFSQAILSDLNA
ncbi:hypothetical protein ACFPAF_06665 [Hymenobacter endophyticus]|uniref:Uncharacterized protein n=1 Tax=Hymenobacter endophyticus TaxID=3076335 RepID=A0ABU3TFA9_9BACT|nr:hypothetical protein [Hymenobacter endophyticus]MDU0370067.1 hypothetical protein [Hymenobacter endophyticus]